MGTERWCWISGAVQKQAEAAEQKVVALQEEVSAMQFTPTSKHGKMLMAKCKTLQEENEEMGQLAAEGKVGRGECDGIVMW